MAAKDIEAGRAHVLIMIRDRMTQGLKAAEQKLKNFGSMVATSAGVLTAGGAATLAWPLKLAANMEQTQVAFEVMLGSADKAKQMLIDIEKMGAETPFTFDQLKDAGQMLLNFNVTGERLLQTMRAIGDVAAGDADKFSRLALAYGQANAKGRLMGQEVNQMIEAGFNPLAEISRTTGRTMADLSDSMEKGQISSAMLANAFVTASGAGGKFNGMMAKQSQTLIGLLSTAFDNAAMVARAFGETLVPAIKKTVTVVIALSKIVTTWVANNKALVGTIAAIIGGIVVVSAAFAGLGLAAMAASFYVGLMASGFSMIAAVIGFVFSPMGALVGVLIGLGVAAYAFRGSIAASFGSLLSWFGPVYDMLLQIGALFSGTITGIIDALSAGNIETAGNIAWAGLLAITFTATSSLIDMVVSMLGTIGQAIIGGNWSLAGAIAMSNLYLACLQGWNNIAALWDMSLYGVSSMWDATVTGMQSAFRTVTYNIASGFFWIAEMAYKAIQKIEEALMNLAIAINFVSKESKQVLDGSFTTTMQEGRKQLEAMRQSDQSTANQKFGARSNDRQTYYGNREAERNKQENAVKSDIARMGAEAAQAAGNTTGETLAADARKKLDYALAAAQEEQAKAKAKGAEVKSGSQMAGVAVDATAKKATAGTFSAVAAGLLGTSRSDAANQTARNTAKMVSIMQKPTATPKAVMAP